MSTEPTLTPDAASGLESARSALTAALSGKPAVSAPPASTPAPVTPPSEAVPALPPAIPSSMPAGLLPPPSSPAFSPVAPPPAETKPVPPEITDAAARRYLEMHGGNAEAALAKALRDNNRLAQLAKSNPELFKPGGPADPSAPVVPSPDAPPLFVDPSTVAPERPAAPATPPVAPEIPINWEQITAETDRQATEVDQVCRGYTQQWIANDQAIKQSAQEIQSKQSRIGYIDSLLKDAAIELPELKAEEFKDERRTLASDIGMLKQDAMLRVLHNDRLDKAFTDRRAHIFDSIAGHYRNQAQEQTFNAELQQIESNEYQRLSSTWPGAVSRAIEQFKIPPELSGDFESYAKQMATAAVSNPSFEMPDVDAFVVLKAREYIERLDRYHRAQAAQYGALAVTRAASPSPTPGPGTPAAPAPLNPAMMSPEEAMAEANRSLHERIRGFRR